MVKRSIYFVMLALLVGFVTACSKDEDGLAAKVAGVYDGKLLIPDPTNLTADPTESANTITLSGTGDKATVSVKGFSVSVGGIDATIPDIKADNVPVVDKTTHYELTETSTTVSLGMPGVDPIPVKVSGDVSVVAKSLTLSIKVTLPPLLGGIELPVTFIGTKK
ncbi:hypothetical protein FACS1894199_01550 [Bacteroidia bacterium]|nr:hypothetical protein FACS1894199_01550 [Bacteroidia bacterium]